MIGLIGLAVMGKNLVLNMERNGFKVAVYNRTSQVTENFKKENSQKNIYDFYDIKDFILSLSKPRKVFLMVKSGGAVDNVIASVVPYLEKGDIIIDGGNSFYKDTERRYAELSQKGIEFMGVGVSGGEEGALNGPAIMPGGSAYAYENTSKIFNAIAAKVEGVPCCAYIGPGGAGHFVKMVHNGIEYADMELICEAYQMIKVLCGFDNNSISQIFDNWNRGKLSSYLIEITAAVLKAKDPDTGNSLVDTVLDKAGQKGTGMWTSQCALELGVPAPTIAEAVFARCMSAVKEKRLKAALEYKEAVSPVSVNSEILPIQIENALYFAKICSYAQGFDLMSQASDAYGWQLDMGNIALIWRGGCIIRANFLNDIKTAFLKDSGLQNLMLDSFFKEKMLSALGDMRYITTNALFYGIPVPAFASSVSYFDSYRCPVLPHNLLQAQRDYFGAHTFERTDAKGAWHFNFALGKWETGNE